MKKIIIGTLVASVIFFLYQMLMWMGGIHDIGNNYTDRQETIMKTLNENLQKDGMYMMPSVDPAAPNAKEMEEKIMTENAGKPWVMIFYHPQMKGFEASYVLTGLFYTLIACLIASLVIFHGNFNTFGKRFLVSMAFAIFTLSQGVLDDMNWWNYPWAFVKASVVDLTFGWGLCSLWLAGYVKKT
jgi:hypothetical protein